MKKPLRRRSSPTKKTPRTGRVDPAKVAASALDRIRALLKRTGHLGRMGPPVDPKELLERDRVLGQPLPPSYLATMDVTSAIGAPERLLTAAQMRSALVVLAAEGGDETRLLPFCEAPGLLVCFDRHIRDTRGELGIVEHTGGASRFAAPSFGEWLDQVADDREENITRAASIPDSLRQLLIDLGFSFDDPVMGRLETGDVDAVEGLLGKELADEVRGAVNRLFDSSGKASLTLNLDEFTVAASVRTGIYVFEAAQVFRWLRQFRDQDFFRDPRRRAEGDSVRDLRAAPREPALVQRGIVDLHGLPSMRLVFRAASGRSVDDFFVLGRTASMRGGSCVVHVERGAVAELREVPDPLADIYVTDDGAAWGLSQEGTAIRFSGGEARAFPLKRPTAGRTAWYGIGGDGERILVWGAGALLEFDGTKFAPFVPDAKLATSEVVAALAPDGTGLSMLVLDDGMGAVARFDGRRWQPIDEDQLIEAPLLDLDAWRGQTLVLTRDGRVLSLDEGGTPKPVPLPQRADAFQVERGKPRALHGLRGTVGGVLFATEGGVIAAVGGEPVFYSVAGETRPARLARVGGRVVGTDGVTEAATAILVGANLWLWRGGALHVVDATAI